MKRNTIKWKIFKYNLFLIILLITLVTVIFNFAVRIYFERDIVNQLNKIASRTEDTALRQGPGFFPDGKIHPPHPEGEKREPPKELQDNSNSRDNNEIFRFYLMLDRSLREPLSVLNADYLLLDKDKNRIVSTPEEFFKPSDELINQITAEINNLSAGSGEKYVSFRLSGNEYIAIIKPVAQKNSFGLSWIIIYSSLQKLNQLQWMINLILFAILVFSSVIIMIFSSLVAKKLSEPFSSLSQHIKSIAERNFGTKVNTPVVEELQGFVDNINVMSEKLETYDKAQKTFLQNASHEFRTPLMSIQSYTEGIKYDVVDQETATDVILGETKRMTHLVEDLLYLSRLDTIEENYRFEEYDFKELLSSCVERMKGIAIKNNIRIDLDTFEEKVEIHADEEKFSRAITNILSNCIRYAESNVLVSAQETDNQKILLTISDDGPGFDKDEIQNIFERFYKGKKGNYGLGLAITKSIIERHGGSISAANSENGALFLIELPKVYLNKNHPYKRKGFL